MTNITIRQDANCITMCPYGHSSCAENSEVWTINVKKGYTVTFFNQTPYDLHVSIPCPDWVQPTRFNLKAKTEDEVDRNGIRVLQTAEPGDECDITITSTDINGPNQCGGPNVKPKMKVT